MHTQQALRLQSNEGQPALRGVGDDVRCYPDASGLEHALATRLGLRDEQVLVTAGGDDAILRACLVALRKAGEAIVPVPTFEMILRYIAVAGGTLRKLPWETGPFPTDAVLRATNERTGLVAVVSPNNPTGLVADARDLRRIAAHTNACLLIDLAYTEFADHDLTACALELEQAIVIRTLSKAYGMAGLRVGYALGAAHRISALRSAGNPFPVAGASIALARRALEEEGTRRTQFVTRVRSERRELAGELADLGVYSAPSQANFVLARFDSAKAARWTQTALAALGIQVRAFEGHSEDALRITCPGTTAGFERLQRALRTIFRPQALLFDLDGVLADVSGSYRRAIVETAQRFGVHVTTAQVSALKNEGDANDDWTVTHRLIARGGRDVSFEHVKAEFERLYQGTSDAPGLRQFETLRISRERLGDWSSRFALGVVTGRPRADAVRFLSEAGLNDLFEVVICREDAAAKPDPGPVELALERLRLEHAWMLGDTPDDLWSARGAGVLPIGVIAPGDDHDRATEVLRSSGAARCLANPADLEELLP